jgi:hypothetical protein
MNVKIETVAAQFLFWEYLFEFSVFKAQLSSSYIAKELITSASIYIQQVQNLSTAPLKIVL